MPYEPPSGEYPHRRFRVREVEAWLGQRAAAEPANESNQAVDPGVEQLAITTGGK